MVDHEIPLTGGYEGGVTRLGNTVLRKPRRDRGEYTRRLLRFLEATGYPAPRFLGTLADGRDVFSFIEGTPGRDLPASAITTDSALTAIGQLIRRLHDDTAGTALADDQEVVCHSDLNPANVIYQHHNGGWVPEGFIDWGSAKPERRVHDLASAAWFFTAVDECGDPDAAAHHIRTLAAAYGFDDYDLLLQEMAWRQQALRNFVRDHIANGGPRAGAYRRDRLDERFQRNVDWTSRYHAQLAHNLGE